MPDLLQEQIDDSPYSSMVTADRDMALVACVWLLADDATPDAIPPIFMAEAVKLVLGGKGIVVLARQLEPAVDVQDGLLDALDLVTAPDGTARHG